MDIPKNPSEAAELILQETVTAENIAAARQEFSDRQTFERNYANRKKDENDVEIELLAQGVLDSLATGGTLRTTVLGIRSGLRHRYSQNLEGVMARDEETQDVNAGVVEALCTAVANRVLGNMESQKFSDVFDVVLKEALGSPSQN